MTVALLTVVAPAVASADPLRPPDGTYRYELSIRGSVAGKSTIVVHGGADAFTVDDDSHFTAMNVDGHVSARYANAGLATVVPDSIPARPIGILSRDIRLVVDAGKIQEVFWYNPATMVVDALDIPAQSIEFRLVDPIGAARLRRGSAGSPAAEE